jgi:hypothetical protein
MVEHLVSSRSDHSPILVRLKGKRNFSNTCTQNRYEIMWEREASLEEEINCAWTNHKCSPDLEGITSKLKATMSTLQTWSKEKFASIEKEMKNLKKELERLLLRNDQRDEKRIKSINKRLDEILYREELMWLQRSRVQWLREGGRNTSFLHRKASARSKKNRIRKLKRDNGTFAESQEEMKDRSRLFQESLQGGQDYRPRTHSSAGSTTIGDGRDENGVNEGLF